MSHATLAAATADDYTHCCRACLSRKGEMRPLYGTCLDTMLMTVADIQVQTGDGLPETLCVQCVLQVSRTFTFKKLCQRSDTTLWQWYLQLNTAAVATPTTEDSSATSPPEDVDAMCVADLGATALELDDLQYATIDQEHTNVVHIDDHDGDHTKCDDLLVVASPHLPVLNESDTRILRLTASNDASPNAAAEAADDADGIEQHMRMSMVEGDEIIDMVTAVLPRMDGEEDDDDDAVDLDDDIDDAAGGIIVAEGFDAYSDDADTSTFLVSVDTSLFDDGDNEPLPSVTADAATGAQATQSASSAGADDDTIDKTQQQLPTAQQPLQFECDVCRKAFADAKVLRRHLKIHSANKPHVCTVCDMSFAESSNLTKHKKKHTGELRNVVGKPNLCSVCGKRFKWASSLSKHMKHHTRHKILTCPYCPKYYVEARSLNIHIRGHTGEKPFRCDVCQKGFTQMGNLDKHMRVHTGEKPYTCPLCGKGFSQSGYVAIHIRTHTGERPYQCADCGKGFAGSNTLAIHRRTHTGERPYACGVCARRFARQETAVIHQRTHTGEKPHVCQVCQRGFTSSGHLTGHMRSHSGEKPHGCDLCGKRFAGTSSLKVHMRGHALEVEQLEGGGGGGGEEQVEVLLEEQPVYDGRFIDLTQLKLVEEELGHDLMAVGVGDGEGDDEGDNVVAQLVDNNVI